MHVHIDIYIYTNMIHVLFFEMHACLCALHTIIILHDLVEMRSFQSADDCGFGRGQAWSISKMPWMPRSWRHLGDSLLPDEVGSATLLRFVGAQNLRYTGTIKCLRQHHGSESLLRCGWVGNLVSLYHNVFPFPWDCRCNNKVTASTFAESEHLKCSL